MPELEPITSIGLYAQNNGTTSFISQTSKGRVVHPGRYARSAVKLTYCLPQCPMEDQDSSTAGPHKDLPWNFYVYSLQLLRKFLVTILSDCLSNNVLGSISDWRQMIFCSLSRPCRNG